MYDLARSCQELQEKYLIVLTEKTHKKGFWYKKTFQEKPRNLSKNPKNPKNFGKKSGKTQELAGKSKR